MDLKAEITEIGVEIVLAIYEVYAKYGLTKHPTFGRGISFGYTGRFLLFDGEAILPNVLHTPLGTISLDQPDVSSQQVTSILEEFKTFISWRCVVPEVILHQSGQPRILAKQLITHFRGQPLPNITSEMLEHLEPTQTIECFTGTGGRIPNFETFFTGSYDGTEELYWQVIRKMTSEGKFGLGLTITLVDQAADWYQAQGRLKLDFFENPFYQYWSQN